MGPQWRQPSELGSSRNGTGFSCCSGRQLHQCRRWPVRRLIPQRGGCRSAPVVDLFPSIDIRSGRVVRLSQGEATRQTVYGDDPVAVAERFVQQGASWIHVVDLDRALGSGDNLEAVAQIANRVGT